MSTPDKVLPSFMNWTAKVDGFEGPFESSNLARREPAPEVKNQHGCQFMGSPWLDLFTSVVNIKEKTNESLITFIVSLFRDVAQLPKTLALLWIPKRGKSKNKVTPEVFKTKRNVLFFCSGPRWAPGGTPFAVPHQTELGRDCMLVTPPSTGTRTCTLVSGPGESMDSGL